MESEIKSKEMGEVAIASDGEHSAIGATVEDAVQAVEQMQQSNGKAPVPAPIENSKGSNWFSGTSWGN